MKCVDLRTCNLLKNIMIDMSQSIMLNHLHALHAHSIYQTDRALHSLKDDLLFDQLLLSMDAASTAALQCLEKKECGVALWHALQLNDLPLLAQFLKISPYESTPNDISSDDILHPVFYSLCLQTLSKVFQTTSHGAFYLQHVFHFWHIIDNAYKKGTNNNKL